MSTNKKSTLERIEENTEAQAKSAKAQTMLAAANIAQNAAINSKLAEVSRSNQEQLQMQKKIAQYSSAQLEVAERQAAMMEIDLAEKQRARLEKQKIDLIKDAAYQIKEQLKKLKTEERRLLKYFQLKGILSSIEQNGITTEIVNDISDKEYIGELFETLDSSINETMASFTDSDLKTLEDIRVYSEKTYEFESIQIPAISCEYSENQLNSFKKLYLKLGNDFSASDEPYLELVKNWNNGEFLLTQFEKKKDKIALIGAGSIMPIALLAVLFMGSDAEFILIACVLIFIVFGIAFVNFKYTKSTKSKSEKINKWSDPNKIVAFISKDVEEHLNKFAKMKQVKDEISTFSEKLSDMRLSVLESAPYLEGFVPQLPTK